MSFLHNSQPQYKRAFFHFSGMTSASQLFWFCNDVVLGILISIGIIFLFVDWRRACGDSWAIELIRFVTGEYFFSMLRESEIDTFSPGSKYVCAGLIMAVSVMFLGLPKELPVIGTLFLAVGDPMARIVGKDWKHNGFGGLVGSRWRRKCLYGKKTLAGSLAFFVFGFFASYMFCSFVDLQINWFVLICGVTVATLLELFSREWDNFWVPIGAVLVMWSLGGF